MNSGTGTNPSNPNSMMDQGYSRNAVYNINCKQIPEVSKVVYSKALGVHDKGLNNQTFFSFGSRNTNFKNHMLKTSDQRALNTTMASLKKHFTKSKDMASNDELLKHHPTALMNDYTKNMSQGIFTPGKFRYSKSNRKIFQEDFQRTATTRADDSKQSRNRGLNNYASQKQIPVTSGMLGAKTLMYKD